MIRGRILFIGVNVTIVVLLGRYDLKKKQNCGHSLIREEEENRVFEIFYLKISYQTYFFGFRIIALTNFEAQCDHK